MNEAQDMAKVWKGKEKLLKASLVLLSAFLMFIGPTYLLYVLQRVGVPHPYLLLVALASFTAGAVLAFYSIREE